VRLTSKEAALAAGKGHDMKIEIRVEGKVVAVEASGAVSVRVFDEPAPVVYKPAPVMSEPAPDVSEPTPVVSEPAPVVSEPAPVRGKAMSDDLFFRLACLRREIADAAKVPAYVVFTDKALLEMVEKRPVDFTEFGSICGVGRAKLEKYGSQFLAVIGAAA
jgi:superfamily II DNA helicase RecQ